MNGGRLDESEEMENEEEGKKIREVEKMVEGKRNMQARDTQRIERNEIGCGERHK